MKSFAIIESGIVKDLIIADTLQDAERYSGLSCVEYDYLDTLNAPNIGLGFSNGIFEQPANQAPEYPEPTLIATQENPYPTVD